MNRNHLALWMLLAIALTVIVCVSIFSPVVIFGHELKDSGVSNAFSVVSDKTPLLSDTIVRVDSVATVIDEPVPVDSAAQTILIAGDSMLEGLYPRLAAYADRNGHTLYAVIWYSSTTEKWGKSDRLRKYIERLKPSFIFISLGANELFVKDITTKRAEFVQNILSDIDTIPYVWIGPPNWKEDTGINSLVEDKAAKGSFFLSKGMKFDRKSDGAHPTAASASEWMDSIVRWMPDHSSHPILLDKPDVRKSRAKKVYVHQPNE